MTTLSEPVLLTNVPDSELLEVLEIASEQLHPFTEDDPTCVQLRGVIAGLLRFRLALGAESFAAMPYLADALREARASLRLAERLALRSDERDSLAGAIASELRQRVEARYLISPSAGAAEAPIESPQAPPEEPTPQPQSASRRCADPDQQPSECASGLPQDSPSGHLRTEKHTSGRASTVALALKVAEVVGQHLEGTTTQAAIAFDEALATITVQLTNVISVTTTGGQP